MTILVANNFSTFVDDVSEITAAATSVLLREIDGFPTLGAGDTVLLTLSDNSSSVTEVVSVTAIDTGTRVATIVRGAGALSWGNGSIVEIRPTAEYFQQTTQGLSSDNSDNITVDNVLNVTSTANLNANVKLGSSASNNVTLNSTLSAIKSGSSSVGADGDVLTSKGTSATPEWVTPAAGIDSIATSDTGLTVSSSTGAVTLGLANLGVIALKAPLASPTFTGTITAENIQITGRTISETGTTAGISIIPGGTSSVTMPSVDIDGGNVDGTAIGVAAASTGKFTSLEATGNTVLGTANGSNTTTVNGNLTITGTATAPTIPGVSDSSTNVATTAFVQGIVSTATSGDISGWADTKSDYALGDQAIFEGKLYSASAIPAFGTVNGEATAGSTSIVLNSGQAGRFGDGDVTDFVVRAISDAGEEISSAITVESISSNTLTVATLSVSIPDNSIIVADPDVDQSHWDVIRDSSIITGFGEDATSAVTLGNTTQNTTINGNTVTINGNFNVAGTTTTVEAATLDVADKNITLAKISSATKPARTDSSFTGCWYRSRY